MKPNPIDVKNTLKFLEFIFLENKNIVYINIIIIII
jgi:hypothetical protein